MRVTAALSCRHRNFLKNDPRYGGYCRGRAHVAIDYVPIFQYLYRMRSDGMPAYSLWHSLATVRIALSLGSMFGGQSRVMALYSPVASSSEGSS